MLSYSKRAYIWQQPRRIWFQTTKEQLDALSLDVCDELQLAPTRYKLAVERYDAVNQLLERPGSPFQFFSPRIFPQGSMALGTTSKPVEGPHDLDFVLQIDTPHWRLHPLVGLHALYQFLSGNETYRKMISLKNRVVRLTYADEFYMDILPAYTGGSGPRENLPSHIDSTYFVYELTLDGITPSPTFLSLREDLENFRIAYQGALAEIAKIHGSLKELDLFPAMPAPVAVL